MSALDVLSLRSRFVTNAPASVPIVYDNQPNHSPDPTKPFIRFSVRPGTAKRIAFGSSADEEQQGRVHIAIFVPRQTGDAAAYALADKCAAIFRNWTTQSAGRSLRCESIDTTVIENEPDWFQVKISVFWRSTHRY